MNVLQNLKLSLAWYREFDRVRADLETYSPRQLSADLRLNPSDIVDLARKGADARVAELRRSSDGGRHVGRAMPLPV